MIDLSKFKVAINSDIILKFRNDLEVNEYYGNAKLMRENGDLIGKEVILGKLDKGGNIFIKGRTSHIFSSKMFEPTIKVRINDTEVKLDVNRDKDALRKGDTFIDKFDKDEWKVLAVGKDKLHDNKEYYCERVKDGLTDLWNPDEIERVL